MYNTTSNDGKIKSILSFYPNLKKVQTYTYVYGNELCLFIGNMK